MTTQLIRPVLKPVGLLAVLVLLLLLASTAPTATYAAPPRSAATNPSRSIVNPSFEQPDTTQAPCNSAGAFVPEWLMPGWGTTHPAGYPVECGGNSATDRPIEVWRNPTVPSADGNQHVELNAYTNSTLYQRVCLAANETVSYSFSHRGRSGTDTARASLQDDSGTIISGQSVDVSTGNTAWNTYTGSFTNNATAGIRRFAFGAVSTATGNLSIGNFLDNITISLAPLFDVVAFTNNTGTPTGTVGENIGTHYLQVLVNGDIVGNPATVTLTRSGTATFGTDYTVSTGATTNRAGVNVATNASGNIILTLPVGSYDPSTDSGSQPGQIRIPITIANDTNPESSETIIYTNGSISHSSGAGRDLQFQIGGMSAGCAPQVGSATLTVNDNDTTTTTTTTTTLPKEVPEGDTLLLLGGGMSGLGVWLRYQWSKRRKQSN